MQAKLGVDLGCGYGVICGSFRSYNVSFPLIAQSTSFQQFRVEDQTRCEPGIQRQACAELLIGHSRDVRLLRRDAAR